MTLGKLQDRADGRCLDAEQTSDSTMRWRIRHLGGWRRFIPVKWSHGTIEACNDARWWFIRGRK